MCAALFSFMNRFRIIMACETKLWIGKKQKKIRTMIVRIRLWRAQTMFKSFSIEYYLIFIPESMKTKQQTKRNDASSTSLKKRMYEHEHRNKTLP